jgi:hypothetical protein
MAQFKVVNGEWFDKDMTGTQVSKDGRIKTQTGKNIKGSKSNGYSYIKIDGKRFPIHRLVVATWGSAQLQKQYDDSKTAEGKPFFYDQLEVHHKNDKKDDNREVNLEAMLPKGHQKAGKSKKNIDTVQKILKEIYYDPDKNTSSIKRLYDQARKDPTIKQSSPLSKTLTLKVVKEFVEKQGAYQRTKTFVKPREFSSIIAPRVGSNLQTDLMFFKYPYKVKGMDNSLNVVDIHSRRAWSVPLKNKETKTVTDAFRKILEEVTEDQRRIQKKGKDYHVVQSVNSDNGKEFVSQMFQDLLQEYSIDHYKSDKEDFAKNAIVERYNRTLRRHMIVDKAKQSNKIFVPSDITRMVKNYNKDLHSTIKAIPMEVYEGEAKNNQVYKFKKFNFKKGDKVRTLDKNALFAKGTYSYSKAIYEIVGIEQRTDARSNANQSTNKRYILENIKTKKKLDKKYLGYEMLLTNSVEESDSYDVNLAGANDDQEAQEAEDALALQRLNRDIGSVAPNARQSRDLPKFKVGDKIQVKWNRDGDLIDKGALDEGTSLAGSKFFNAVIRGYSPRTKLHKVYYPEDRKTYQHNFSKPDEDDFIRRPYWRIKP